MIKFLSLNFSDASSSMLKNLLAGALVALAYFSYKFFLLEHPVPKIDHDAFWGRVQPQPDDPAVRPFRIEVPESVSVHRNKFIIFVRFIISICLENCAAKQH